MFNRNAYCALRVRPVAIVATLAVAVGVASQSVHADPGFPLVSSVRINLSGVDLSTAAGQKTATERLVEAARLTCQRVEDELDLSRHDNYLACVDATLTQTMPKLAELVSRRSVLQMAGNTSK
jgi:UrcA family protein